MIALLAGCALHRVEHYEPVGFRVEPPEPEFVAVLPYVLASELGGRRLRSVATPDDQPIAELPPEVQYAIYACTKRWTRGAELDLQLDLGQGPYVVQLRWTPRRELEVEWAPGEPLRAPMPGEVQVEDWMARLTQRYGLAGFGGPEPWLPDEVGDVAFALGRLSEPERAALHGVTLLRDRESPRAAKRELAYFDPTTEPPSLWFFDLAFDSDPDAFVGPVEAPVAAGVTTALHEFGHLVADAPLRRAYEAYLALWEQWQAEADRRRAADLRRAARERYREYVRLGRSGPVVEAWEDLRDGRPGPSTYGFRDPDESFAEAFALYHVDPDALDRALPGAVAWFASGAHLQAAGLATAVAGE